MPLTHEADAENKVSARQVKELPGAIIGTNNGGKRMQTVSAAMMEDHVTETPARPKLTLRWRGKTAPVPDFVAVDEPVPAALPAGPVPQVAQQLRVDPWTRPEPLDYCLECWKEWMAGDADKDLGTKTMRGLVGDEDGYGVDLYESQQSRDARIAAATDAMIESLSRLHFWAIYKSCSIDTAWRFPNADLIETAAEARRSLVEKLKKNVCTGILF